MAARLPEAIAAAIARGATVITPNQRAARAVRQAFDAAQQSAHRTLWQPANALPLDAWLENLWHQRLLHGRTARILLNRTQQHALWREIIVADPDTPPLRSPDALADMAARAWNLLCLHRGRGRLREFPLSTDSRAFERWSRAFERRLARAQLITASEPPAELAAGDLPTSPLVLVDFDTLAPALSDLFTSLAEQGSAIEHLRTEVPTQISLLEAGDDAAELASAAHWLRQRLDAHPHARLAVVVPNLADRRPAIDRAFGPILSPDALPITTPASPPIYEFSLGQPLAELPIAVAALDLLAWPLQPLPLERIGALLLSPWFGAAEPALAEFDAFELRASSLLRPELTLDGMLRCLERSRHRSALAEIGSRLRKLRSAALSAQFAPRPGQSEPLRQPHAAWAEVFRILLDAAGWTRPAESSSLAFQQHRRFDAALDELATLDFDAQRATAQEALAAFTRILRQAIFAPESLGAPIQILGPLEVGGVAFDGLWFLGADDLSWPAMQPPNPLLPWQMHRALNLPGSDRAQDDAHAQALTQRIAGSATETVFSFALRADEGTRRVSPLVASLPSVPFAGPVLEQPLPPQPYNFVPEDAALPPLPHPEVRGGAQILKLQAACAFRAFAEKRLFSTQPESQDPGFDALERGNLAHAVMQFFWTEIPSRAALAALPAAERDSILDRAIDRALSASPARTETAWDMAYVAVQIHRLQKLLQPWLALELRRADFTVQAPEQEKHIQLGPLRLKLRIDRIDSTPHGEVILDYKTGLAAPSAWKGDRPDEPQLPLYAILAQEEGRQLAGVAFALLRAGDELGMKGYAHDAQLLAGTRAAPLEAPTLELQVDQWRVVLTRLAEDFAAGDTRVAPKLYPRTCEHCTQRILCRLDPSTLEHQTEDEADAEGEPAYV
jgi:probable DNA repair protein